MSGDGKGFFGRLRARLNRGGSTLAREIRTLLQGRQIDAHLLEELEERLIGAGAGVYDALQAARARTIDVLLADTAGRLHSQAQLMAELAKIRRVLGRIDPT